MSTWQDEKVRKLEKRVDKLFKKVEKQESLIARLIENVKSDFREVLKAMLLEEITMDITEKSTRVNAMQIEVDLHGFKVNVQVDDYIPAQEGNRSGHPDTWTEDIPYTLDWYADSGNLLLDYIIDLYDSQRELLEKAILEKILNETTRG